MDIIKVKQLHQKFLNFSGDMSNEWEEYSYLDYYIGHSATTEFVMKSLASDQLLRKTKSDSGGMQVRFMRGGNSKSHFINAIGLFEAYISQLAQEVFVDYPQKMNGEDASNQKLFELILKNETREAMIEKLAEEKVRSIFYGNPTDVFLKDKCKFELGDIFTHKYVKAINLYKEIIGRRNAIIHNCGRIDQKYLRENKGTTFKEGEKIIITGEYLRGTIGLLLGIAAKTTECVVEKIYKGNVQGIIKKRGDAFSNLYNAGWYERLLSENTDKS